MERRRDLFRAIANLKSEKECERFFSDLCTPAELAALADRWAVALLVERGLPYREIQEKTSVSTTTITRVARALRHGDNGYRLILDRDKEKR
jgi:TrpR-related protein YerC/YecD